MRARCAKSAHVPERSEHTLLLLMATVLNFLGRFCSKRGIFVHCSFPERYLLLLLSEQRWLFANVVCRRPNERSAAYLWLLFNYLDSHIEMPRPCLSGR